MVLSLLRAVICVPTKDTCGACGGLKMEGERRDMNRDNRRPTIAAIAREEDMYAWRRRHRRVRQRANLVAFFVVGAALLWWCVR